MDEQALALLKLAGQAYSQLISLAVDITVVSDMEDHGQRTEQRIRAIFAAPDKVRTDSGRGAAATVSVSDGVHQHHYFGSSGNYVKHAIEGRAVTGFFQPEFPSTAPNSFLFPEIAERVDDAWFGEGEMVSVQYAPSSRIPPGVAPPGPVHFRIDRATHLVTHVETLVVHGRPFQEPMHRAQMAVAFTNLVLNPPLSAEAFEFTPPPGAVDLSERLGRGGSGSRHGHSGPGYEIQTSHSREPDGTLIEESRMRLDGVELTLERRLKRSGEGRELRLVERVSAGDHDLEQWQTTVRLP